MVLTCLKCFILWVLLIKILLKNYITHIFHSLPLSSRKQTLTTDKTLEMLLNSGKMQFKFNSSVCF